MIRNIFVLGFITLVIIVSSYSIASIFSYHASLKINYLFTLPVDQCEHLSFGTKLPVAFGADVTKLCQAQGFEQSSVFAVSGSKAIELVPRRPQAVTGHLKIKKADPQLVYFYSYREKYRLMIEKP